MMKFKTTLKAAEDSTATGIVIPNEVLAALGAGKKPPVKMTVNGYAYRSTVATVNGEYMVGFNADHRAASGIKGGDPIEVSIELDTEPRTVELPADFAAALNANAKAKATFEKLSNSLKGYHVTQVTSAKTDETRQRRIEKSIATLHAGKSR
jgi:bifunctional DNA-binding transcriptional regulator/antitoxin component of YhaV-PrlF toxin-antitoxin module